MTAPYQYGTPQASDPTAVMGRRTLAWIADLLLYTAAVAIGIASMVEYVDIPPGIAPENACIELERQTGELPAGCFALEDRIYLLDESESAVQTGISIGWFALFVIVQGVTGGSPGKLLFGLRVVDRYGTKIRIGKSLGRTLLWAVDAAPWIIPLVGPIAAFTSTGHRRVGDIAAGTYVVSSSSVGQPIMAGSAPIPSGQQAWGAAPPSGPPPMGEGWPSAASPPPPSTQTAPVAATPDASSWSQPSGDLAPDPDPVATPERTAPTPPPVGPFAAPGAEGPPVAPQPAAAEPPPAPRYELPPPQWDPARSTYLQWEPNRQAWLQWDAAGQRWKPIDT